MQGKHDKPPIHLDYASLGGAGTPDAEIDRALVKKAKGMFGKQAREEILQMVDHNLRIVAAEVAQRQVKPELLYGIGLEAVGEAIKAYKLKQEEGFREFAVAFARQSMFLAKGRMVREKSAPARSPIRQDDLGAK
ncbi:MAG TPA: hypothetical protein VMV72_08590 [Verrucomicrobiae bacterium]|nr:hypothetical protein [Verrucomicrobiae bacterium]